MLRSLLPIALLLPSPAMVSGQVDPSAAPAPQNDAVPSTYEPFDARGFASFKHDDGVVQYSIYYPEEIANKSDLTHHLIHDAESYREELWHLFNSESPAEKGSLVFERRWNWSGSHGYLISLWAVDQKYTAGAHLDSGYRALLWNEWNQRPIPFKDLFLDWPKALRALTSAYCEKAEQVGEICPDFAALPVAPVGAEGEHFKHIRFLFDYMGLMTACRSNLADPGEDGVGLTLPVTEDVLKYLKPNYRDDFEASTCSD